MTGAPLPGDWEPSLADLYENAPVGQLSVDRNDVIVKVNATLLRWLGTTADAMLGTVFRDHLTVGSMMFYDTRFQPVLGLGGFVNEVSLTMKTPDGPGLPVLVNAQSVEDEQGVVRLVRFAIFDATSRQGYERELLLARRAAESSEARVRVLQDASMAFGATSTESELAVSLMMSARKAVAAGAAAVLFLDPAGDYEPVPGSDPLALALAAIPGNPIERARAEQVPVSVENAKSADAADREVERLLLDSRFEAMTAVPLLDDSDVLGVLVLFFGRARVVAEELIGIEQALARQAVQVLTRIRLQTELQHLALHDGLTGLANRRLMADELGAALSKAIRESTPMAVLFLDLDGFKAVNDDLGHGRGDEVLLSVAKTLSASIGPGDLVSRFGGDEFAVILRDVDEEQAIESAERIVAAVAEPIPGLPERFPIAASAGLALYQPDAEKYETVDDPTAASIIALADAAMYRSKDAARGCVTVVRA